MGMPMYVPPEQLIRDRADFARKGVGRGRSIVALEYEHGVLLCGENSSRALHKVSEIYDQVAFAGVGRFNEFEALRVAGIRYADLKGYAYDRADVMAKGLANAYSQTLGQIFTHEVKPYEIEVLVAEVTDEPAGTQLFRVQFDGTLHDETAFGSIGGQEEQLREALAAAADPAMSLEAAVQVATTAIQDADERAIPDDHWEAAVLDRQNGRRKFRRLSGEDIAAARS